MLVQKTVSGKTVAASISVDETSTPRLFENPATGYISMSMPACMERKTPSASANGGMGDFAKPDPLDQYGLSRSKAAILWFWAKEIHIPLIAK
jgi:hypothetical protein